MLCGDMLHLVTLLWGLFKKQLCVLITLNLIYLNWIDSFFNLNKCVKLQQQELQQHLNNSYCQENQQFLRKDIIRAMSTDLHNTLWQENTLDT